MNGTTTLALRTSHGSAVVAVATACALLLTVPPAGARPAAALETPSVDLPPALQRVLADYEAAWQAKDAPALAALFAEDGFVLSSDNPPVRGRAAIERHYAGAGGPLSLRAFSYRTEGDAGYILGGFARRKGEPDIGKFTLTLRRDPGGRWLIASDMDNGNGRRGPAPAPPTAPYEMTAVDTAHGEREFHLLWPEGAPGAKGTEAVDKPKITAYLAPADRATGAAVVVCPGGGYRVVAADHEGKQIAEWLNSLGVSAFVLQYRLGERYRHPAPLQDAQRAIRMVRSRAAEWRIDPQRVGILGFSAGGHLASTAATHFDDGRPGAIDPIERQVTARTPPTFLWHTADDTAVPVENSILFFEALRKAGVPGALHVFPHGRHGLGLAPGDPVVSQWPALCARWMEGLGLLRNPGEPR